MPAELLDLTFALDRYTYYYRHVGEQWLRFADDPFTGQVALLPFLDPARARGTFSDVTFLPAVNSDISKAATEYNALLSAVPTAVRTTSSLPRRASPVASSTSTT